MLFDTLKILFKSSNVKRYHVHPIIGEQNIAHHSWRLAMLLYYTLDNPSPNLIKTALMHDCAEVVTGDTPYTAKRASLDLKRALDAMELRFTQDNQLEVILFEPEKLYLKTCDMLELVWFCREQIDMGNANFVKMFDRGTAVVTSLIGDKELPITFRERVKKVLEQLSIPGGTIYEY